MEINEKLDLIQCEEEILPKEISADELDNTIFIKDGNNLIYKTKINAKTTALRKAASTGEVGRFRKGVICEPYIAKVEIDQSVDNQFLFMASDGIWDVVDEKILFNTTKLIDVLNNELSNN